MYGNESFAMLEPEASARFKPATGHAPAVRIADEIRGAVFRHARGRAAAPAVVPTAVLPLLALENVRVTPVSWQEVLEGSRPVTWLATLTAQFDPETVGFLEMVRVVGLQALADPDFRTRFVLKPSEPRPMGRVCVPLEAKLNFGDRYLSAEVTAVGSIHLAERAGSVKRCSLTQVSFTVRWGDEVVAGLPAKRGNVKLDVLGDTAVTGAARSIVTREVPHLVVARHPSRAADADARARQ